MVALPASKVFWRKKGQDANSWTESAAGVPVSPTDGDEIEVLDYAASESAFIVADTVVTAGTIPNVNAGYGSAISVNMAAGFTGTNLVLSLVSAPAFLSFNPTTNLLTGTAPSTATTGTVVFNARNSKYSANISFDVVVSAAQAYLNPASRVLHADSVAALGQSHSRVAYVNLTGRPITNLEVFYANFSYNASVQYAPTSSLSVRAGVEYPSGTKLAGLTTDGTTRDITIAGGAIGTVLKASGLNIPAGATYYINTRCLSIGGDGNIPRAYANAQPFNGVNVIGWTGAADGSDYTTSGSQPNVSGKAYGAFAVCSREVGNKQKVFAIFGDSIARGNIQGKSVFEDGILNAGYSFMNFSFSGSQINAGGNNSPNYKIALARAVGCSEVIMNYPVNDLINYNGTTVTLATIQAAFTNLWTNLKSGGFIKIIQATCTPNTTDATSPGTPVTTPAGSFTGGSGSYRSVINAWFRSRTLGTVSTPDIIYEMSDVLESARDSGLWLNPPTNTVEGRHPSVAGATTVCTDVTSKFPSWGYP